jgi:hypothetical protein
MDNLMIPESEQDKCLMVSVYIEPFGDGDIVQCLSIPTEEKQVNDGLPPPSGWHLRHLINMLVKEHPVGVPVLDTNSQQYWIIFRELNDEYLPLLEKVAKAGGIPPSLPTTDIPIPEDLLIGGASHPEA